MSGQAGFPFPGKDPFTAFWQDFTNRMTAAGMQSAAGNPSIDAMNNIRRIFFDSFARHAEEFMRSEAFLKNMKQAMDAGLAWQQTLNETMQKGLAAAQMPSRADSDHLTMLVRGMEERIMNRLNDLSDRVATLEGDDAKPARKTAAKTTKRAGR